MSDTTRDSYSSASALPAGTRLGEFEILKVLGVGGFGIVYLAFDHQLEREAAVKEYMPTSLVDRTETMHVSMRSRSDTETFELGLRSFVNEAKMLAKFDHPSLIKVHRFWEANGTAYMAMPVLRGRTLKQVRQEMGCAPDEAWLRATLAPLLEALEMLHNQGVYHRDISPDNVHVEADGHPVLVDFGAARRVISDKTQSLTAILKPAYAPIEQYAEAGSVKQGAWTDLYSLGATLHFLLIGYPPAPATTRAIHDEQAPLAQRGVAGISHEFLQAVDWMLAPRPADRPQSVRQLRERLAGRERGGSKPGPVSAAAVRPATTGEHTAKSGRDDDATVVVTAPRAPSPRASKSMPVVLAVGAATTLAVLAYIIWSGGEKRQQQIEPVAKAEPVAASQAVPPPPETMASAAMPDELQERLQREATERKAAQESAKRKAATVAAERKAAEVAAERQSAEAAAERRAAEAAAERTAAEAAAERKAAEAAAERKAAEAAERKAAEAAAERKAAEATSPEKRCSGRNFLSHAACMEIECWRTEFRSHVDCMKWRENAANPQPRGTPSATR